MKKSEEVEKLEKELEEAKKQIEELTNNWKRALADYQNLEKRILSEREEVRRYATGSIIKKLLDLLELINQAQKHLNDEGLNLIVKQFNNVLSQEDVVKVLTEGKEFDPLTMECVETVIGEEDGKVAEELSPGFLLKENLLKPAKVKVYKKNKGG